MPSPSAVLSTQRPDLAASFQAFDLAADQQNYIGTKVAPVITVAKQAGNFGKIPLDQLLQNRDTVRAPGSGYSRGKFTFLPATYACIENGAEETVDDREAEMYSDYLDAESVAAARAFNAVLRNQEQRWAAALFNTTTWTGGSLTAAAATAWSTVATATPLVDIESAVQAVYANSGLWPNALIISRKCFRNLRRCQTIIDLVKYSGFMDTRAGNITTDALAQCFDLKYVIVAGGTKNTATEGQTATPGQIWNSTNAMVCRVAETNDPKEPCIARTFSYEEDGGVVDGRFETYRDETVRGEVVRVRHDVCETVMYTQAGFLITGC
jgi:hypothetical protein